jgi:hypothetical protein
MISEEKISANYVGFVGKLKKYNCYTEQLENDVDFNTLLMRASHATVEDSGCAYEGSLVEMTTRITMIAFAMNGQLAEEVRAPAESLFKVCHLHQISKALMISKNTVDWEIKKGKMFTFNSNLPALKTGEYSIYLCYKYGIELSEEEYEAISSIDKENDSQTKYFSNMLSQLLRLSIDLATSERKIIFKSKLKG